MLRKICVGVAALLLAGSLSARGGEELGIKVEAGLDIGSLKADLLQDAGESFEAGVAMFQPYQALRVKLPARPGQLVAQDGAGAKGPQRLGPYDLVVLVKVKRGRAQHEVRFTLPYELVQNVLAVRVEPAGDEWIDKRLIDSQ